MTTRAKANQIRETVCFFPVAIKSTIRFLVMNMQLSTKCFFINFTYSTLVLVALACLFALRFPVIPARPAMAAKPSGIVCALHNRRGISWRISGLPFVATFLATKTPTTLDVLSLILRSAEHLVALPTSAFRSTSFVMALWATVASPSLLNFAGDNLKRLSACFTFAIDSVVSGVIRSDSVLRVPFSKALTRTKVVRCEPDLIRLLIEQPFTIVALDFCHKKSPVGVTGALAEGALFPTGDKGSVSVAVQPVKYIALST